jgi:hypothetical protein
LLLFSSKIETGFRNMRNIYRWPMFQIETWTGTGPKISLFLIEMAAVTDVVLNVESVDRNTFCRTIITSINAPIRLIMCQVNVFILQKGEIFISISECSWLILLAQLKFMTSTDFQTIVRGKDYCKIQVILNLCLIKFSVPESFETYRFLKQQIMILFSGTMKW